jgi:hypothetical protein
MDVCMHVRGDRMTVDPKWNQHPPCGGTPDLADYFALHIRTDSGTFTLFCAPDQLAALEAKIGNALRDRETVLAEERKGTE